MVNAVFNPAAVQFEGEAILLARVKNRRGISHLCFARSAGGLTGWVLEPDRSLLPDLDSYAEKFGIENPRVTLCDGGDCGNEYVIVYTATPAAVPSSAPRPRATSAPTSGAAR